MAATAPEGRPNPTLRTERLVLRPLTIEDAPTVSSLASDEQVATRTANIPYPYTVEAAEAWLTQRWVRDPGRVEIVLGIEREADGALMGAIALVLPEIGRAATLGYWLGRTYWGRGYATEAAQRMLAYAFEDLGAPLVDATAFPDNAASIRVQEKLGMSFVRNEWQATPARGGERKVELRAVTRAEWEAR